MARQLEAFRAARAGVRHRPTDATTAQALSKESLAALRARNEAFWALSQVNRQVCGRARFCFRRDSKRKALFSSYAVERAGVRKPAAPTDSAKPTV